MQVATAPDGNGGVYRALQTSGCLDHMREHGVRYVDCYCVDNAAARVLDPVALGAFAEAGAQVGCRAVCKASPEEPVGGFATCAFATRPAAVYGLRCAV